MKKKILIVLLALCLALGSTLLVACSGDGTTTVTVPYTDEAGVQYTLYKVTSSSGTEEYVKVTGYDGKTVSTPPDNVVSVYIPSEVTIEGTVYPVTAIANMAFYRAEVTNVYVGENVKSIESFAFAYGGFTSVELPSTVTSISEYAFVNCPSLRYVSLAATEPPKIGDYAFMVYNESSDAYEVNGILSIKTPAAARDSYISEWNTYAAIIK